MDRTVEKEIAEAIAQYELEFKDELQTMDRMISDILDSKDQLFRKFWLGEELRKRLAYVSNYLCGLKSIYESRN